MLYTQRTNCENRWEWACLDWWDAWLDGGYDPAEVGNIEA